MTDSSKLWPELTDSQRADLLSEIERLRAQNLASETAGILQDMRWLIPFGFTLAGVCLGVAVVLICQALPINEGRGLLRGIALAMSEASIWYFLIPALALGGFAFFRGMCDLIEAEFMARDRQMLYLAEFFELLNRRGFPVTQETVDLIREARRQRWLSGI